MSNWVFHRKQRRRRKKKEKGIVSLSIVNYQYSLFVSVSAFSLVVFLVPCCWSLLYTALRLKDFLAELLPNSSPGFRIHSINLFLTSFSSLFSSSISSSSSSDHHLPPLLLSFRFTLSAPSHYTALPLSLSLSLSPPAVPDRRPFADRITNPTSHCLF